MIFVVRDTPPKPGVESDMRSDHSIGLNRMAIRAYRSSMEVFLCYPREHSEEATRVANFFRSVDVPYWRDTEKLIGGEDWDRQRRESLREANAVVVICGAQITDRDGVYHREINEAVDHLKDKRFGKVYIIPVRASDVALPPEIQRFQYIDLFEPEWEGRLAKSLVKVYEQNQADLPALLQVAAATSLEASPRIESIAEKDADFEFVAHWPVYKEASLYWKYVNNEIQLPIFQLYYQRKKWFFEGDISIPFSYAEISVSEFFRSGDVISLTTSESIYAGGAHPNHSVTTVNILGDGFGKVSFHELFEDTNGTAEYLADFVNLEMKRQKFPEFDIREYNWSDDLSSMFEQFNLNDRGLRLNLSSNSGLPHVLSGLTVYVPWESLGGHLLKEPKEIFLGPENSVESPTEQSRPFV